MSSNKLYIGNLDYGVTSNELSEFLSAKGKVVECKVIEGKGFAFVSFEDGQTANEVKEELNDVEFKGRKLKIDNARENTERRDRKPSYGGSGGGGGGGFKKRY